MSAASQVDNVNVPTSQSFDVGKMLANGHLVALSLVPLIPLIMVMEDECNDVVESINEAVLRGHVDQAMEAAI